MCLICQTIIGKNKKPYSPHTTNSNDEQSPINIHGLHTMCGFCALTRQTGYALISFVFTDFRYPF